MMNNQMMHQYGQQSNLMYSSNSGSQYQQDQYKAASSASASRKRIENKQSLQQQIQGFQSNQYDPASILSSGSTHTLSAFQQSSSKNSSSSKENHVFKSNASNYIQILNSNYNSNGAPLGSGASSTKGNQNKDVKLQVAGSISANQLKQHSSVNAQNLHQQQHSHSSAQQQPLSQNNQRKSSISNSNRPQKFSISIQNRDSSIQQEILSDDRNYTSHIKKQSYQHGVGSINAGSGAGQVQGMFAQPQKSNPSHNLPITNANSAKSQINFQQHHVSSLYPSSTSSFTIQNGQQQQNNSASSTLNAQTKNITKDLINYKILQIQANSTKMLNSTGSGFNNANGAASSHQTSNSAISNQQNNASKYPQQLPNNSGRSSQQLVITSARRADSSSSSQPKYSKAQEQQQQQQQYLKNQHYRPENLSQQNGGAANSELSSQQLQNNNKSQFEGMQSEKQYLPNAASSNSQYQQIQSKTQQPQQIPVNNNQQLHYHTNNSNTNTNSNVNFNNNNNQYAFSSHLNNSHSLHEKNNFSLSTQQQQQQQHNPTLHQQNPQQLQNNQQFNSNTLNNYPFLNNNINTAVTSSNFSSFGTLPKGTSAAILKQQQQNAQSILNALPHYQMLVDNTLQQSQQQTLQSQFHQHHHAFQKNNELEISSTTNLVLSDHDIFKDLINNRGSTKNPQKNSNNYFSSQQSRQQQYALQRQQAELNNGNNKDISQQIMNKSPDSLATISENYCKQQQEQNQQQAQTLQQQKSTDLLEYEDYEDDDDDTPVVHNHAQMQQKYSKRVGISVSAVPDISKLSSLINKCGVKRVGIDMTTHKQLLESKKSQPSSNSTVSNQIAGQLLMQQASQPTSVKNSKSSTSLIPYYQQLQKKLKSQIKEETTTQKQNKEGGQIVKQSTQSNNPNLISNNYLSAANVDNISSAQAQNIAKKPLVENNHKSRLHQQKIKSFYQQNSQNQYYLVNPNQKPKVQNQNLVVPATSQNSSQMNSNYNLTHQSLQKEDELYTNKSERLMYNNYTSNAGSNGNTIIQHEEKPGFQSERFNYINAQYILQNQINGNNNYKENESTSNNNIIANNTNNSQNKTSSHLKVAQQLVQQHQKIQSNILSSQMNEQVSLNQQSNIQKKQQEKQQAIVKQQSGNFIDNTTNTYYYPQVQDIQNNTCNVIPQSISHTQTNIPYSQSLNYGVGSANTSQINHIYNHLPSNQNQSLNIPQNNTHQQVQNQGSHMNNYADTQNNLPTSNVPKTNTISATNNNVKSHLKANPTVGLSGVTSVSSANTKYSVTAVASASSVSSTQNLHAQQNNNNNETLSNLPVSPNVPTQMQFSNQVGQMSATSNNSSNNRKIEGHQTINGSANNVSQFAGQSGNCQNMNNVTHNSALNQNTNHKNLLSTAIKSETTQYSNFSSDSPLVCNENLSGILTNRYGDNSQFKNYLSSKSNNVSCNNIIQGQNTSNNNLQPNTSSLIQPHSDNKEKFTSNSNNNNNAPAIQNFMPTQQVSHNSFKANEDYNNTLGQQQSSLNNYGGSSLVNNTSGSNNENYKPSHKKNLSNHLMNKLGAICKGATEGSQLFTQSSSNNSYNKDSFNNNLNNNGISNNSNQKQDGVSAPVLKQDDTNELVVLEDTIITSIEGIPHKLKSEQGFNYLTNKSTHYQDSVDIRVNDHDDEEEEETMEQQLLNFSHRNIVNENIEYRIKDMKEQELDYIPNPDYFDNQKEITCMMRCILFDWMFDVCMGLTLKRDTLYLSLNYVDRYLSLCEVTKLNLQLIGAVSLFMACKIEEIHPPSIGEFAKCTDDGYTIAQIVEHELQMLKAFEWKLNPPTPIVWLNIYTEIWDRFIKSSFDKPNKYQVNFVQDQKLQNKAYLILYRIPEQKSYMLYRQMTQILDLMQLDANVLRFESRMLIASLMYLQLGIYYKQFTKKQVHAGFNEKYLFANSLNNFNEYFNSFLTQHFSFNLIDILSSLQYVASFFDIEYNYSLSPAAQTIDPSNNEMSYEDYLSYQTYFPNGIDYMRKRYCS